MWDFSIPFNSLFLQCAEITLSQNCSSMKDVSQSANQGNHNGVQIRRPVLMIVARLPRPKIRKPVIADPTPLLSCF